MVTEKMTSKEFRERGLQLRTRSAATDYKQMLLEQIQGAELPEPTQEYRFHDERKWRFDFAFIEQKVAVEYDGGITKNLPSHSSVSGIHRDIEKGAEAQLAGWVFLRVTPQLVANGTALRYVKKALEMRAIRAKLSDKSEAQIRKDAARTLKSVIANLEKDAA